MLVKTRKYDHVACSVKKQCIRLKQRRSKST